MVNSKQMMEELKRLAEIKREKDLSYEHLAQSLGVSFNTVYRWLNNKNEPSQMAVARIRDFIGKS